MGVQGLWSLLQPDARPIKLEDLEGKRFAVDSSIWLYHFRMAMRDKEGRTLSNAHILGFFWRICKLLHFGLRPVFVFDGGAPVMKRQTLIGRKTRKAGAKESHALAAKKLLNAQMRQAAIEHVSRGAGGGGGAITGADNGDAGVDDPGMGSNVVYLDDYQGNASTNQPARPAAPSPSKPADAASPAKKKNTDYHRDPYALPHLDEDISSVNASTSRAGRTADEGQEPSRRNRGRRNDFRFATDGELRHLLSSITPSDIDMSSPLFRSLPFELQYELVGDMRAASRGTSYKRLQQMLKTSPNPIDFSKAQVLNLKTRNQLTQRVLEVTDEIGDANIKVPIRVAGERNREYVLVRKQGDEGGFVLGVRNQEGTSREKAIVVGGGNKKADSIDISSDEDEDGDEDRKRRKTSHNKHGDDDDEMELDEVEVPVTATTPTKKSSMSPSKGGSPSSYRPSDANNPQIRRALAEQLLSKRAEEHIREKMKERGIVDEGEVLEEQLRVARAQMGATGAGKELFTRDRPSSTKPASHSHSPSSLEYYKRLDGYESIDDDSDASDAQNISDEDEELDKDELEDLARALQASADDSPRNGESSSRSEETVLAKADPPLVDVDEENFAADDYAAFYGPGSSVPAPVDVIEEDFDADADTGADAPLVSGDVDSAQGNRDDSSAAYETRAGAKDLDDRPEESRAAEISGLPPEAVSTSKADEGSDGDIVELRPSESQIGQSAASYSRASPALQGAPTASATPKQASPTSIHKRKRGETFELTTVPQPSGDVDQGRPTKASVPSLQVASSPDHKSKAEHATAKSTKPQEPLPINDDLKATAILNHHDSRSEEKAKQQDIIAAVPEAPTQPAISELAPSDALAQDVAGVHASEVVKEEPADEVFAVANESRESHTQQPREPEHSASQKVDNTLDAAADSAEGQMGNYVEAEAAKHVALDNPEAHLGDDTTGPAAFTAVDTQSQAAVQEEQIPEGQGKELVRSYLNEPSTAPESPPHARRFDSVEGTPIEWSPSPSPAPPTLGPDGFPLPTLEELERLDDEYEQEAAALQGDASDIATFISRTKGQGLIEAQAQIAKEVEALRAEHVNTRKSEEEITKQMAREIQMMLRLFGLPYITAPMEAEAQCAELVSRKLVDGIITDDSDVFLFGGTRIYKNMFNNNKVVECFLLSDIQRELGLDREKLVRLAYLLGSDYTEGLPSVGPVVAMEVLSLFPGPDGLLRFREWWLKVQGGKDTPDDTKGKTMRRIKKTLANKVHLDEQWPNPAVLDAYYEPAVDSSDEPFQWGLPDLDNLRLYLGEYLGWPTTKTDQYVVPVIEAQSRRTRARGNQSTLDRNGFFDVSGGTGVYAGRTLPTYGSTRLQNVVNGFRQANSSSTKRTSAVKEKTRNGRGRSRASEAPEPTEIRDEDEDGFEVVDERGADGGQTSTTPAGDEGSVFANVPEEQIGKVMARQRPIVRREQLRTSQQEAQKELEANIEALEGRPPPGNATEKRQPRPKPRPNAAQQDEQVDGDGGEQTVPHEVTAADPQEDSSTDSDGDEWRPAGGRPSATTRGSRSRGRARGANASGRGRGRGRGKGTATQATSDETTTSTPTESDASLAPPPPATRGTRKPARARGARGGPRHPHLVAGRNMRLDGPIPESRSEPVRPETIERHRSVSRSTSSSSLNTTPAPRRPRSVSRSSSSQSLAQPVRQRSASRSGAGRAIEIDIRSSDGDES